jgi:hypothetical protein
MTVPSSTSRDQQAGNGTTTAFTIPFRILDQTHLRVLFTIAGVTTDAAATVTFLVAPSSSTTITFLRDVPATQETDYVPNDPFPAESHEQALDKLTMLVQQLREEVARAITIPATVSGVDTELPTPVGTRLWGWDALAAAPRYFTPAEIATAVAYAAMHYDTFTASAAQTDFTLDADPGSLGNLDVSIDGVTQVNGTDFTYSGTTLTFAVAMAGGEKVLARYGEALPAGITSALAVLFQQSGTGAVTRTMQDKAREFVSVKDFGALGDAATDDTIAVQAALDAHDNVYFPPGTYVVSALTFAGKRLFGDGATLFWKSGAVGPLITVSSGGAELRGIKFDGNAAGHTITTSAHKIDRDQASVIACEFRDFHGRVLTFNGENSLVAHSYFHDTGVAANCNCVELTNRGGQVLGNRFITIGDGHVVRVGYQSVVRDCDGFVIANNFVQTTLHGTFTCELGANRGVIIGNTIDGADAAYKTETDASVYDVTIAFNTVMNLTDAGPIDLNSTGVNYIGNRHYNLPNGGPFFGDLGRCEGNFFRDVGTMGVWTAGDRVDFINNTIIDPDVVLAGQIITVEGGCRVAGNRIVDTASDNLGIGVRAFGANNLIESNVCEGLDQGILLGTTCANSIVRNNHVTDCPNQAATVAGDGTNMVEGNYGFAGAIPVKVIAGGVLTISPLNRNIRVGTEGAAATDDLDTISGGVVGQVIILGTASNSQDTTVKDGTGNLGLAGDFAMLTSGHRIMLEFNGTNWFELSRCSP